MGEMHVNHVLCTLHIFKIDAEILCRWSRFLHLRKPKTQLRKFISDTTLFQKFRYVQTGVLRGSLPHHQKAIFRSLPVSGPHLIMTTCILLGNVKTSSSGYNTFHFHRISSHASPVDAVIE